MIHNDTVVSIHSDDQGQTWSVPSSIELAPPLFVPNAYAIIVAAEPASLNTTRLYSIYNLNIDNITNVSSRNDELGYFYMKHSDDGGVSWSSARFKVPYPQTWIDRNNVPFHGTTNIMWTVDHVKINAGIVYFAFTKIGDYVQNPPEEIYVMSSSNLLTAMDPQKIKWAMLPEHQDHGITCPLYYNCNTTVMEEGHVLPMSTLPNRMVVMARTSMGYLAAATRDDLLQPIKGDRNTHVARYWNNSLTSLAFGDGGSFVPLKNVTTEDGKVVRSGIKHPRGPFTAKSMTGMPGVWIMLYYNNKGGGWYGRDPYFLTIGREVVGSATTNGVSSFCCYCFHNFFVCQLVSLTFVCFSPRSVCLHRGCPKFCGRNPKSLSMIVNIVGAPVGVGTLILFL
jgi:hypothetical protein